MIYLRLRLFFWGLVLGRGRSGLYDGWRRVYVIDVLVTWGLRRWEVIVFGIKEVKVV